MLTRSHKEEIVGKLSESMDESKIVLFADYRGLNVKEMEELKKTIKEVSGKMQVARKTLMNLVLKERGIELDTRKFAGPLAFIFGKDETEVPGKVWKFSKKNENLKIEGGILENRVIEKAEVESLAKLPAKEQILGQLVGVIQGPIRGLVGVTSGVIRSLVNVVSEIKKAKE